jgi:hypothetical protein
MNPALMITVYRAPEVVTRHWIRFTLGTTVGDLYTLLPEKIQECKGQTFSIWKGHSSVLPKYFPLMPDIEKSGWANNIPDSEVSVFLY